MSAHNPFALSADAEAMLAPLIAAARSGGAKAMEFREEGVDTEHKGDGSPVTIADRAVEAALIATLAETMPGVPALGEEQFEAGACPDLERRFLCIDPIDGTKQFISGDPHWVISIGLIDHGHPLAGVVFAPALGRLFAGVVGEGGWVSEPDGSFKPFRSAPAQRDAMRVVHGGFDKWSDLAPLLEGYGVAERKGYGSAYKFGLIAIGEADIFPRDARVWEWDTAGGEALIMACGGTILDLKGNRLAYGKVGQGYRQPPFIARAAIA